MAFETPVLVVVWKRFDTTQKVIDCLAKVKPRTLYVAADGPSRDDQIPGIEKTRALFDELPWDCEVVKNYSDENLGLALRVTSGISDAFRRFEDLIVLEDDILTDPSFFYYCDELLERYRDDARIMQITGVGPHQSQPPGRPSYTFTQTISPWGWATWRRAWEGFDHSFFASSLVRFLRRHPRLRGWRTLSGRIHWWPRIQRDPVLKRRLAASGVGYAYWLEMCDRRLFLESWAGLFGMWVMERDGLVVHPMVNMCHNIGFTSDAVHTRPGTNFLQTNPPQSMPLPLIHPERIDLDEAYQKTRTRGFDKYWGGRRGTVVP